MGYYFLGFQNEFEYERSRAPEHGSRARIESQSRNPTSAVPGERGSTFKGGKSQAARSSARSCTAIEEIHRMVF